MGLELGVTVCVEQDGSVCMRYLVFEGGFSCTLGGGATVTAKLAMVGWAYTSHILTLSGLHQSHADTLRPPPVTC